MERYWNDPELMSKIASKMGALKLSPGKPRPAKKVAQANATPCFLYIVFLAAVMSCFAPPH